MLEQIWKNSTDMSQLIESLRNNNISKSELNREELTRVISGSGITEIEKTVDSIVNAI
jgi:hypothetical protein